MFDFAEKTIGMTAVEILNYYRNLYYTEPQVTERGIIANALNDILPNMILPPVNVGQTVYTIKGKTGTVTSIHQNLVGREAGRWVVTAWFYNYYADSKEAGFECGANKTFYFNDFGKTVFLTSKEAEKALVERGANHG